MPTAEADLALSRLCVSAALFHPVPLEVTSFLATPTPTIEWVDILRLLLPVTGIVMLFAILHVVGLLPWR